MNVAMVERNCADCPLRTQSALRVCEAEAWSRTPDPENESERQLEQLERSLGANWKW